MMMRNHRLQNTVLVSFFGATCCAALALENAAEQVDTRWSSSRPVVAERGKAAAGGAEGASHKSTFTILTPPPDPRQRMVLQEVLEEARKPLIHTEPVRKDTSPAASESPRQSTGSLRMAARPDGLDDWHSPGPVLAPFDGWQVPARISQIKEQEPATSHAADPTEFEASKSATGEDSARTPPASDENSRETIDEDRSAAADLSIVDEAHHAPTVERPKAAAPPLTPQLISLRGRLRSVLAGYYRKTLNSRDNDPWEAMHGMLAYGVQSRILQGGPRGEPVTAVGWLCYNKPCKNLTLLQVTPQGELRAKYGVGLQGHLGQFLAMLAQCRVAPDYPIRVGKHQFTILDLIEAEKKTCYPKSELTFKLIAFQYYLDLNEKWVNDQGLEWDIPRVIREELAQPIRGAACGGTHRLSSLSLTVKARQRRGEPLDGEYARAAEFVQKYHQYAFRLQNRDGSLSTAWFQGRGEDSDINRRIKTTGHILEWLCYSLSDEELRQPQTVRAVTYLTNLMYTKYNNEWEVGPMCHAIHALLLYDERVFQPFDGPNYEVAYRPKPRTAGRVQPNAGRR